MSETSTLSHCPFCGSSATGGDGFSPLESVFYVWCSNDECGCNPAGRGERMFTVDEWNRRAALPVAPSDADRELMQEALALISWHCFGECRVMPGPLPIAANIAAALRTRLLRHSEGKE